VNHFARHADGRLFCEDVDLAELAEAVGTPAYVYSKATLERHVRVYQEAWRGLEHQMCFAVKACSNLSILKLFASLDCGFDIVSEGELRRVLLAGGSPSRVVFSGVGKTEDELAFALRHHIACFNVESVAELHHLERVAARLGLRARVSLRVNPDVDAETHPYIATGLRTSKFGIPWEDALDAYHLAATLPHLDVIGVACHIGSQLARSEPFVEALDKLLDLVDRLAGLGIPLEHVDIGGGLGITYREEAPPSPEDYAEAIRLALGTRSVRLFTEPGRVIVGNAGVLLMRCLLTKDNGEARFVVVDAGMNDAIRPALYGAWHAIEPVGKPRSGKVVADVVGPVCETGDFFARARELPPIAEGDLLVMRSAGAYGFSMSSNYNSRPRPPEVLVDGRSWQLIRRRETWDDLWRPELDALR
jgi:diaminopimelate decarboxylase